jgi:hypothetical protein
VGLLALVIAYSYSMFYIIQISLKISEESTGLRIFSILLFGFSLLIYLRYLFKYKRIYINELFIHFLISFILISAMYTSARYGYINDSFRGLILSFGVRAIPAMLIGALIARINGIKKLTKWVQPIMIAYTLSIFTVVISNKTGSIMGYKLYGLDRQSVSYYSVFALGMNIFLILYNKSIDNFKIFKSSKWVYINYLAIILQLYCTFAGGGRGAFVLMIIFIIYYIKSNVRLNKIKNQNFLKTIMVIVLIATVTYFTSHSNSVGGGYRRIFNFFSGDNFMQDYNREALYLTAFNSFKNRPIFGHGIGGVSYEVGFYSHDIFLDILVDGGLTLLLFYITLVYKFFEAIKKLVKTDRNNSIILIIFLSSFIMLLFSGSYLADSGIWFTISYALSAYKFHFSRYQGRFISKPICD